MSSSNASNTKELNTGNPDGSSTRSIADETEGGRGRTEDTTEDREKGVDAVAETASSGPKPETLIPSASAPGGVVSDQGKGADRTLKKATESAGVAKKLPPTPETLTPSAAARGNGADGFSKEAKKKLPPAPETLSRLEAVRGGEQRVVGANRAFEKVVASAGLKPETLTPSAPVPRWDVPDQGKGADCALKKDTASLGTAKKLPPAPEMFTPSEAARGNGADGSSKDAKKKLPPAPETLSCLEAVQGGNSRVACSTRAEHFRKEKQGRVGAKKNAPEVTDLANSLPTGEVKRADPSQSSPAAKGAAKRAPDPTKNTTPSPHETEASVASTAARFVENLNDLTPSTLAPGASPSDSAGAAENNAPDGEWDAPGAHRVHYSTPLPGGPTPISPSREDNSGDSSSQEGMEDGDPFPAEAVTAGSVTIVGVLPRRSTNQEVLDHIRRMQSVEVYDGVAVPDKSQPDEWTDFIKKHKITASVLCAVVVIVIAVPLALTYSLSRPAIDPTPTPKEKIILESPLVETERPTHLPSSVASTHQPTGSPSTSRFMDIRTSVVSSLPTNFGWNTVQALEDEDSPQRRALDWLAHNDSYFMHPSDVMRIKQRFVVATLFYATGGGKWIDKGNFMSNVSECDWLIVDEDDAIADFLESLEITMGITCSEDNQTVLFIYLVNNHLKGTLPEELGLLTALEEVWLGYNYLSGVIPSSLSQLQRLKTIGIIGNELTGPVPTQLGEMKSLENLFLSWNELGGTLPTELGLVTSMEAIELGRSGLTGTIPTQIGNMKRLERLQLQDNELGGTLPTELGLMTGLWELDLSGNWFTGTISTQIGNVRGLEDLYLNGNELGGTLPTELGLITNLTRLVLTGNGLTGTIPTQIGNVRGLGYLNLEDNELGGTLPTELGLMTGLWYLDITGNGLTGTIPTQIGNMERLAWLYLEDNELGGTLPTELGLMTGLSRLYLSGNGLTGTIPTQIGNFRGLGYLNLEDNELGGTLPTELGLITNLTYLDVSGNGLTGTIPTEICHLVWFDDLDLDLHDNQFSINCSGINDRP